MKVITANLNGIRSAAKKGFFDWLAGQSADLVCLQEIRAQAEQLQDPIFHPTGYHCYYNEAQKKGYSGVAIYSKQKPLAVSTAIGWEAFDNEGRYLMLDFGSFQIVSLYLPSGSSKEIRQAFKYTVLDALMLHLQKIAKQKTPQIWCGDWNIAHKEIDIKNWRANQKNSGFLPLERAWMDALLGRVGWTDAFRQVESGPDQYTWWSNRGQAWQNNTGWRIDYQITSAHLANKVSAASIYRAEKFSDHAPLIIDYAL